MRAEIGARVFFLGGGLKRIKKERKGSRKVTSGIWVVTHSSAGERLGSTHDPSFLRGRALLYLVNMSHLICAATVRAARDPADAHPIL